MSRDVWRHGGRGLVSDRDEGLIASGNHRSTPDEGLRGELSRQVANYLDAVRDRETLPPHAFPAGFFTDAFPASAIAALAKAQDTATAPLAPVAPVGQRTSLTDVTLNEPVWLQPMPDFGRRVQLWWDEMAPGHAALRTDEIVRFVRRAEWLGRVDEIFADRFTATVWDQAHPGAAERAEFFLAHLSAAERARLADGVVFYWTVGYAENAIGERTGASRLRVRRRQMNFPPELQAEAKAAADAMVELLDLPPGESGPE